MSYRLTSRVVSCSFSIQRFREPFAHACSTPWLRQSGQSPKSRLSHVGHPPHVHPKGHQRPWATAVKGEPDFWRLAIPPLGSFSLCGNPTLSHPLLISKGLPPPRPLTTPSWVLTVYLLRRELLSEAGSGVVTECPGSNQMKETGSPTYMYASSSK